MVDNGIEKNITEVSLTHYCARGPAGDPEVRGEVDQPFIPGRGLTE
jgi:hypothetical protein